MPVVNAAFFTMRGVKAEGASCWGDPIYNEVVRTFAPLSVFKAGKHGATTPTVLVFGPNGPLVFSKLLHATCAFGLHPITNFLGVVGPRCKLPVKLAAFQDAIGKVFPRASCKVHQCQDVTQYEFPIEGEFVAFAFHPFIQALPEQALAALYSSLAACGRLIFLVCPTPAT